MCVCVLQKVRLVQPLASNSIHVFIFERRSQSSDRNLIVVPGTHKVSRRSEDLLSLFYVFPSYVESTYYQISLQLIFLGRMKVIEKTEAVRTILWTERRSLLGDSMHDCPGNMIVASVWALQAVAKALKSRGRTEVPAVRARSICNCSLRNLRFCPK